MTLWTGRDLPVLEALLNTSDTDVRDGYLSLGHGRARQPSDSI
jgi:hypothetical protein